MIRVYSNLSIKAINGLKSIIKKRSVYVKVIDDKVIAITK